MREHIFVQVQTQMGTKGRKMTEIGAAQTDLRPGRFKSDGLLAPRFVSK